MKLLDNLRALLPLAVGLVLGSVGVFFFLDSLPGAEGSPEARAQKLERDLKRAQQKIAALEAIRAPKARGLLGSGPTLADGTRSIAEDLRAGRPVTPEDVFRATRPLLRDLAPLFDRMRLKQQKEWIDAKAGELARKYDLAPHQQDALAEWFEQSAEQEAARWNALVHSDTTRLEDLVKATHQFQSDKGLERFMAGVLPPDRFAAFEAERMEQRMSRIQQKADLKVQRLDAVVNLDESQRDTVFGIMARSSPDFDASMELEGSQGVIGHTPADDPQAAMLAVLRPEQRAAYDAERKRRHEEASKDAAAIGLTLPDDWEMFDDRF